MKIGIFGGAFDPPHLGHVRVLETVEPYFDEVWAMPAYDHMYGKKMAPANYRLWMLKVTLLNHLPLLKIRVSDFEIVNQISDGTFSLMSKLSDVYPDHHFSFIIGQDNADSFHRWRNYEQLCLFTPFFVLPREGYPINTDLNTWYMKEPHFYLKKGNRTPEISSTTIRQEISRGGLPGYIDSQVYQFILQEKLYLEAEKPPAK